MKFRYTIDNLKNKDSKEYMDDLKMLRSIVIERQQDCTNAYSPLYTRLQELYNKLSKAMELNDGSILNNPNKESITY